MISSNRVDVNQQFPLPTDEFCTLLYLAVRQNNYEGALELMKLGADSCVLAWFHADK